MNALQESLREDTRTQVNELIAEFTDKHRQEIEELTFEHKQEVDVSNELVIPLASSTSVGRRVGGAW